MPALKTQAFFILQYGKVNIREISDLKFNFDTKRKIFPKITSSWIL